MKKTVLTLFFTALALTAFGERIVIGRATEAVADTNNVVTIADIIKMQERVTSQHTMAAHFDKVWSYKSFFNLSYLTNATLNPKKEYKLGYAPINNDVVPKFKADFGVALQLGHNYNLLKNPVANIVNFNIDYTYIDLTMTHYNKEPGEYVYNSDNTWKDESKNGQTYYRQYLPWGLSKYDIRYGMNVGPSITVAPFTPMNVMPLHFLKLNIYYHIGYQVGVLWMGTDKEADAAKKNYTSNSAEPTKLTWQHGLMQSFGFNLSWKTIGIGFETRWDNSTYKSIEKSTYGSESYNFGSNSSRIYIRICY